LKNGGVTYVTDCGVIEHLLDLGHWVLDSDLLFKGLRPAEKEGFNGGGCVLIWEGVDLVTVHGKLEWEALGRTGRIVKKERIL